MLLTVKLCKHLFSASAMPKAQVVKGHASTPLSQAALLALHIKRPCLCRVPRVAVARVAVVRAAWKSISTTLLLVIFECTPQNADVVLSIACYRRHCPISSSLCSCRRHLIKMHQCLLGTNCITGWELHCDCGRPGELLQRLQPCPRYIT